MCVLGHRISQVNHDPCWRAPVCSICQEDIRIQLSCTANAKAGEGYSSLDTPYVDKLSNSPMEFSLVLLRASLV